MPCRIISRNPDRQMAIRSTRRPTQSEEIAVKYFTPDLIARGQSDDGRVLDEVEALWDERCASYNAYIASIRNELNPGLRHIEDNYYLHDAIVRSMGYQGDRFVIVLQLDAPPRSLLTFTYHLVELPRIDPYVLPEAARSQGDIVEWQYDEIDKVHGELPTWRQSILLSNGWEIVLHFRDVEVAEMQALLPVPSDGAASWMPAHLP
jgi:hypothetical protein